MEAGENTTTFLEVLFQALERSLPRRERFSSVQSSPNVSLGLKGIHFGHCPLIFYSISLGNFLCKPEFSFYPCAGAAETTCLYHESPTSVVFLSPNNVPLEKISYQLTLNMPQIRLFPLDLSSNMASIMILPVTQSCGCYL